MFFIRADGNPEIGSGHIMRCLTIAQALLDVGQECMFVVADQGAVPTLEEAGMPFICLHSVWNDLDQETDQMEALIAQRGIRALLIDSYFVTPDYLRRLHRRTHVICMDDLNLFHYPCSTLINYAFYADAWNYPARYSGVNLLLGPRYAPLRREFQDLPPHVIRQQVRDILVTTGGGDPLNIAVRFVQRAKQTPAAAGFHYHIVAGRFNRHLEDLDVLARRYPGVSIHRSVTRMSELMCACDIAVSAAGTTLYELCACGLPTLTYVLADNQIMNAVSFAEAGTMLCAGDIRQEKYISKHLFELLDTLADDRILRQTMAERMQSIVDGKGADRLAEDILKVYGEREQFE